jgi:hypothetical protein
MSSVPGLAMPPSSAKNTLKEVALARTSSSRLGPDSPYGIEASSRGTDDDDVASVHRLFAAAGVPDTVGACAARFGRACNQHADASMRTASRSV